MQHALPPAMTIRPSPHFDDRPPNELISLLVIHNISLPAGEFSAQPLHSHIDALFMGQLDCDAHPSFASLAGVRVSAHCVIWRDGQIFYYVPFDKRAWHAGISSFDGRERCNDYAIGVELEGTDNLPYTEQQYQSLIRLTHYLRALYPAITADRITGHSDIAPGRKTDPGNSFDWNRYRSALAGLSKEFSV